MGLERKTSDFPELGAGFTEEERKENWNRLKDYGSYEIEFFGDFVIYGVGLGCKKNILVFNTSLDAAAPIYVITPERFGGTTDSDIPIVLAYNQVHYESMYPSSIEDIQKTKCLVHSYITGNYTYSRHELPYFLSNTSEDLNYGDLNNVHSSKEDNSNQTDFESSSYENDFPPLEKQRTPAKTPRNSKETHYRNDNVSSLPIPIIDNNQIQDEMLLCNLLKIKPANRTTDEKKRIK